MPTPDAIDKPEGVTAEDMQELLKVDLERWKTEIGDIEHNHYPKFGKKLPNELNNQLNALRKRLG
jgi:phosphoenolpyruvate carboxykinase (GTP)